MDNLEMDCFVYILRCKDDTLYTGWTNHLENRLKKHQRGLASKYTRARLPVVLVYYEEHSNRSSAMKREIAIKNMSRKEKENLIQTKTACRWENNL